MERIVSESVEQGAQIILGGGRLNEKGPRYYKPTIVKNVLPNMPLYEEEVFGPVAALVKFESSDDAIRIANNTDKGLAAYAYTNDLKLAWKLADAIEAGMVGINEPLLSTCEAPFGN